MSIQNSNIAAEKLRIAMVKNNNINITRLALMMGMSPSNACNKFKRNNLREAEIRQFAEALGYDLEITLVSRKTDDKI